ncbi:Low-specificity L-threonine aldolase [Smittium mucronatum]|uniref:Low-specificity L-threonine aldolase n=1 Tax=Smittium mucronatum TaxID=133383 RepID=A0A1R0H7G5_9FUNG|nr:Low-specificity L-threonine aldolase [Smittium mucronatum]
MSYNANESKNLVSKFKYDMRSDTVTCPTPEMINHMVRATVGDDVYGEDLSTINLQNKTASLCGMQAGLYCVSGTLSNQLALRTHLVAPPYSVLCDKYAHINVYEAGGVSFHSRAHTVAVKPKNKKYITVDEVKENFIFDQEDVHSAPTRVISLENTINGVVSSILPYIFISVFNFFFFITLDGARLWNASVKSGVPLQEYGKYFDSISICFSKGLGAPMGSMLLGSSKFIKKATHFRKLFGAGWRQAGFMAEAANYAIDNIFPILKYDHARASSLASQLSSLGISFDHPVETNMVFADFGSVGLKTSDVAQSLESSGVLIMPYTDSVARIVFHHLIDDGAIELIVSNIKGLLAN